jgi:hypothetical protein
MGVGRMGDNDKAILVSFPRRLTDDELHSHHWPWALSAIGAPRWLVRAGGDNYETWICSTDDEVRRAFCEALYGTVSAAEADDIDGYMKWFRDPRAWDDNGWRDIKETFEDGWLEVIDLGVKSVLSRSDGTAKP